MLSSYRLLSVILLPFAIISSLGARPAVNPDHPLYIGFNAGFGSTTWRGLVPNSQNQSIAMSMSTPVDVQEGGVASGFFIGYEWTRNFALEVSYMQYPEARVWFDTMSLFSFTHDGQLNFFTNTETLNLMAKIFLTFPNTTLRVYSSTGIASIHRDDSLKNEWRTTPSFGVGVNFLFNEHVMGEIAGNYTAGFGESMLNPTESYFPFLYSVICRLAYRF